MGSALDNGHLSPNNGFKLTANSAAQFEAFFFIHLCAYSKPLGIFEGAVCDSLTLRWLSVGR